MPIFVQNALKEVISVLKAAENMQSSGLDFKYLSGQKKDESYIKIRIGGYRIGAEIIKPNIILITCGSRGDV